MLQQALRLSRDLGDLNQEGLAHWGLGRIHYRRAELTAADACYAQALRCFRQAGNREDEAWTHLLAGLVDGLRYDQDQAMQHLAVAEAIFRDLERLWGVGAALTQRGTVHLRWGDLDSAEVLLNEALAIFQTAGNRWEQAAVLWRLGLACHHRGQPGQALDRLAAGG